MRYGCLLFLAAGAFGQTGNPVIRGELQFDDVRDGQDYQIEVADCAGGAPLARAFPTGSNRFEIEGVAPGCKLLRVVSGSDKSVVQETQLFVEGSRTPLTIRVPRREREPSVAGTVSVERLRHPIPHKAAQALTDANRLWRAGRVEEAAAKLRPAVERFPDIWEMRLNLGIIELKLEHFEAAAQNFLKAHQLQPRAAVPAVGAGFALLHLNRIEEAERAAHDAVALQPENQIARALLLRIQSSH